MVYPQINAAPINGTSDSGNTVTVLTPEPLLAGVFGVPQLTLPEPLNFTLPSIQPVRFGDAFLQAGMPPNNTMLGVSSLRPVVFGKPAVSATLVL